MKITVLHGQNHKGSTYKITNMLIEELKDDCTQIDEYHFLNNTGCVGCYQCFKQGEEKCPHFEQNKDAVRSLEEADLIIIESSNYCMGMTGQLKVFMDHMAFRWITHRPHKKMFFKTGVAISTAAGAGSKKVVKDISQNMFYWGIPFIQKINLNTWADTWENISEKRMKKIKKKISVVARKINNKCGKIKPSIKLRMMFGLMKANQKNNKWSPADKQHWESQGWLEKTKPWSNT